MKNKNWIRGHVHWFDEASGEGIVKDEAGQSYFVHCSAIISGTLTDKAPVRFQIVKDTTFVQVSAIENR